MLNNKKAQIGETMTWIVATLVIVVILSISILFTIPLGSEKKINIEDKEKDFLATKSITSFLSKEENVKFLENKDYEKFKIEIEPFLKNLPISLNEIWNFELYEDNEKKIEVFNYPPINVILNLNTF